MATTIHDVLLRVSIENGNMKLGPIDTSLLMASLQKVRSTLHESNVYDDPRDSVSAYRKEEVDEATRAARYSSSRSATRTQGVLNFVEHHPNTIESNRQPVRFPTEEPMEYGFPSYEGTDGSPRFKSSPQQFFKFPLRYDRFPGEAPEQIKDHGNRIDRLKHERIENQRAANRQMGFPDDQGIEQFSQWELMQDPLGGIAGISMRRQAGQAAIDKGFKLETNLGDLQKNFTDEMSRSVQDLKDAITRQSQLIKELGNEFSNRLRDAIPIRELFERLNMVLEEKRSEFDRYRVKTQS